MKKKENRLKKKRFYQRKGLWIFLFSCLLLAGLSLALFDHLYLKKFRERATTYDMERVDDLEIPSVIFDRNKVLIGRSYDQNRSIVTIDKVPPAFINALLAQEDQRFFDHKGVDWVGVARAFYLNFKAGETTQGASTITMQLARNAFDLQKEADERGERGFERKIVESFVALRIEEHYVGEAKGEERVERKKQLLEMYVNRVHFGKGYYGIRAAALGFFGKEPQDLTLSECASLVCCIKNPFYINPIRNPERNMKERNHVFNRMKAEGSITNAEWETLTAEPVVTNPKPLRRGTSHLYEKVVNLTRDIVGDDAMSRGGFKIYTTVDRDIQQTAREQLRNQLLEIEKHEGYRHPLFSAFNKGPGNTPEYLQGAVLVTDSETGAVLAHVGGRDFFHSQYDFIESGRRPLGTTFLPVVYTAAFERGLSPATLVDDLPMDAREVALGGTEGILGEWGAERLDPVYESLNTLDGGSSRPITARKALRDSKVAATVRLGNEIGIAAVAAQAKKMDLPLGSGEMLARLLLGWEQASLWEICRAYSAYSQGGLAPQNTYYVERILDAENKEVYRAPESVRLKKQYFSDATAYQVHSILSDVTSHGNLADLRGELADPDLTVVKTGTNHNFSDAWAVGYNGKLTCGVWVGFWDGRRAIHDMAFGRDLAFPIWSRVMNTAARSNPGAEVPRPATLTTVQLCEVSGRKATRYCYESVFDPEFGVSLASTAYPEYLRVGQDEVGLCPVHGTGGVAPSQDFAPDTEESRQRRLSVPPIIVSESSLLGDDPYQSRVVEAPEEVAPPQTVENEEEEGEEDSKQVVQQPPSPAATFRLTESPRGEREATIRLRTPPRIEMPEQQ
ncbi:MAG: transglycosylase domain-containing protein [Verrucomicrobiota bacterium JB023]|nr:transglycosylase domain-containing protein [Verrucomicrobiota bacterium JB023]